ncbi:MAG: divalent-cation tolerance protein CutA, partial [bacterium]
VNILPVHSMYWWKGNLEEDSEDLLIIKTTEKLFEKLKHKVIEIHPYEVPEIMAIPVLAGYEKYLKWLSDSIANLDV